MKKLFYTLGICMALSAACSRTKATSNIVFTSPQPEGERELREFPARLLGEYSSGQANQVLSIHRDGIFLHQNYPGKTHIKELDSTCVLIGDSLLREKGSSDIPIRRVGDSLYFHLSYTDTLFKINADHILRKAKNYYILNSRQEEGWLVSRLEKKNKLLTWCYIDDKEAGLLKKLSDHYIDSVPYQFRISTSKFKEFIKSDGFKNADTFKLKSKPHQTFLRFKN